jgi:hypothetical protein
MRTILAALFLGLVVSTAGRAEPVTIRVGHFPNITHCRYRKFHPSWCQPVDRLVSCPDA